MKLYGHPDSGHSYKVKFCLAAADIAHDYEVVDIFSPRESRPHEFRQRAQFGEVPLLLDGAHSLTQSGAILVYLAQEYGVFGGEEAATLQQCLQWLMWEANKIGLCLPQIRADKKFAEFKLSSGARDWLSARYQHDVGVLEQTLADQRPFIIGDEVTIADFALCGYLFYAHEAQVDVPKQVQNWLGRLAGLQGWAQPSVLLSA